MTDFIKQQIFPGLYANLMNKKIAKNYKLQEKFDVDISEVKGKENEYILKFDSELKIQIDRKIKIEDKAKSLLFIITLAITTITFSLNYLKENSSQIISIIFIFISVFYFISCGIRALQTLNIRLFNINQPNVEYGENKFIIKEKNDTGLLVDLVKNKSLNDLINVQLSNLTYASYILIRNGLIFFGLFFISTISLSYYNNKKQNNFINKFEGNAAVKINDTVKINLPYSYEIKYEFKNLQFKK